MNPRGELHFAGTVLFGSWEQTRIWEIFGGFTVYMVTIFGISTLVV